MPIAGPICRRGGRRRRRGASAVELAIILPVVIAIAMGCVDFGRCAYTKIAVVNAARVGADFASIHPVTSITRDKWDERLEEAVVTEMFGCYPLPITIPPPVISTDILTEPDGLKLKRVRVVVIYPFNTVVNWPFIPASAPVGGVVEMRIIR